jgi:adenosylcobinamide-GDP ribazoletransferase
MMGRLLGALQFLTVVPVRGSYAALGESAIFFPIVGAILGATAGGVMLGFSAAMGRPIGALLAIACLLAITGCLHEDGLADVADAVRAGRSREKMMEILKDSRIGTYGAIALILSIALRWESLAESVENPVAGLAAALALSRMSLIGLAALALPLGAGMGRAFSAACSRTVIIAAVAQSIAIAGVAAVFIGWFRGVAMMASTAAIVFAARHYFTRRLGGVNGDCLGATSQAVETANLLILACHRSF